MPSVIQRSSKLTITNKGKEDISLSNFDSLFSKPPGISMDFVHLNHGVVDAARQVYSS